VSTAHDSLPTIRRQLGSRRVLVCVATGLVLLIGAFAAGRPSYAILALAPLVGWLLWCSAVARLTFVVLGGLLILVSNTNHLTASKAGYFGGLAFALVAIVRQPEIYGDLRRATPIRALLPMTLALAAIIVISLPVAHAEHTSASAWLRDAATYGLAAAAPLLIWDSWCQARRALASTACLLLIVCGLLSGLSLVVELLGGRSIISSRITLHLLPGIFLPGALALLLAASANRADVRAARYATAALAIPIVILLTGTRAAVALLVCVVLVLFAASGRRRTLLLWLAAVVTSAVAALGLLAVIARSAPHGGLERLVHRITAIPDTMIHPGSDTSYNIRAAQWHVAWQTFKAHPLAGVGPGHMFVFPYGRGLQGTLARYFLDSPLVFLAKFGVVGLVALVPIIYGLVSFLRLQRRFAAREVWLALLGYLVFAVFYLPLDWALEAKDFVLGFILLGALAVQPAMPAFAGLADDWARIKEGAARHIRVQGHALESVAVPDDPGSLGRSTMLNVKVAVFAAIVALAGAGAATLGFALSGGHTKAVTISRTVLLNPPLSAAANRAEAQADVRVWRILHCGPGCRLKALPLSVRTGLWELRERTGGGTYCSLLDVRKFNPARPPRHLPPMNC
jgi:O-antigen ligase